eukprot:COSAG04_NODE_4357_length_2139_cov_2.075000_1_plen_51_part_10
MGALRIRMDAKALGTGENVRRAAALAPALLLFPLSALKVCADARRAQPAAA